MEFGIGPTRIHINIYRKELVNLQTTTQRVWIYVYGCKRYHWTNGRGKGAYEIAIMIIISLSTHTSYHEGLHH